MKKMNKLLVSSLLLTGLVLGAGLPEQRVQAAGLSRKTFVYNRKQSAKVNAKRRALLNAQNKLSDLQAQIKQRELATEGAAGFFAKIAADDSAAQSQKQDAQQAYALVKGQSDAPSWYDADVHLGSERDATSLPNLFRTLRYYDQYSQIRNKYSLSMPQVSLTDVAVAMLDADYSSHVIDHARYFDSAENLAWGVANNPNYMWMSEEKTWNEGIAKDPSLASYKNDAYGLSQKDPNFYESVGHYLNLIDPETNDFGYALNTDTKANKYGDTEAWDADVGNGSYDVSDFQAAVTAYYDEIAKPDQVKAAKAKVKAAKKSLRRAIKQSRKNRKRRAKKRKKRA